MEREGQKGRGGGDAGKGGDGRGGKELRDWGRGGREGGRVRGEGRGRAVAVPCLRTIVVSNGACREVVLKF